jgi:hypothetical protein
LRLNRPYVSLGTDSVEIAAVTPWVVKTGAAVSLSGDEGSALNFDGEAVRRVADEWGQRGAAILELAERAFERKRIAASRNS